MNLDKDDLFRNAAPGFVFIIVVLSYYLFNGRWTAVVQAPDTILALVSGFPLGFIIQNAFRMIFHIDSGEQDEMEKEDNERIKKRIKNSLRSKFQTIYNKYGERKTLAQWLAFSLNKKENEPFKNRIGFLISQAHSLGACWLAIILAFVCIFVLDGFWILTLDGSWLSQLLSANLENPEIILRLIVWGVAWSFVFCIFYRLEKEVKKTYRISRAIFIRLGKLDPQNSWLLQADSSVLKKENGIGSQ